MTSNTLEVRDGQGKHHSTLVSFISRHLHLSAPVWIICLGIALLGLLSANPFLTFVAVMMVPVLVTLVWRQGEPPVLFFVVIFQWLQITTKLFNADFRGITVEEMFQGWTIIDSIWLSMLGLLVLAVGIRIGTARMPGVSIAYLEERLQKVNLEKLTLVYLWTFAAFILLKFLGNLIPQAAQIIGALRGVKWVALFILAYVVIHTGKGRKYIVAAGVAEVIIGFSGYFSDFKQVFFVLGIAFLTVSYKLNVRTITRMSLLGMLVLYLGIVWTSVKEDYRDYISGGTTDQVVVVSFEDRMSKLLNMYTTLNLPDLAEGLETLIERVGYVDYFAHAIRRVPSEVPFDDGEQLAAALRHIMLPRILFPDKPPLPNDTFITAKYTGVIVLEASAGASVSMGYMAQCYVDYGRYGMFFPILMLGILFGILYRSVLHFVPDKMLAYGGLVAIFVTANQYETHLAKILGGTLTGFVVLTIVLRNLSRAFPVWIGERSKQAG